MTAVRVGLIAFLASGAALAQSTAEQAFDGARAWTVEVKGSVATPFIEDEQGSYSGAGLVVDAKRGWVLTNAHIASHSPSRLAVAFQGTRAMPARRVYVDPYLDLAVIAYDPARLDTLPTEPVLDCESFPSVGHPVGAFGHPWGFRFTGTRGITSAITSRMGPTMLQTDAPINAGNSGGPLISLETGKVVGVNAAKIASQGVEGLSFAVPMPYACSILALLAAGEDPSPPAPLVDFAIDEYGDQTLLVARSRLPAGTLDLRAGDTVVAVAPDSTLDGVTDLYDALRGGLGQVALVVERDGKTVTITGSWPKASLVTERRGVSVAGALFAGSESMAGGHLDPSLALMVHHVEPGSPAEGADLQPFDLLVSIDGKPIPSLQALEDAVKAATSAKRPLDLMLLRFGSEDGGHLFDYQRRQVATGP